MSYLVEIDKVIRGNIQKGTIEILKPELGVVYKKGNHTVSGQHSEPESNPPSVGSYYCFDTTGFKMASYYKNTNAKILRFYAGVASK